MQPGGTAAVSGASISSTAFNTLETDIGTEITNSVDRLGRGGMQANLPMGGYRAVNAADPIVSTDLATKNYVDALPGVSGAFYANGSINGNGSLVMTGTGVQGIALNQTVGGGSFNMTSSGNIGYLVNFGTSHMVFTNASATSQFQWFLNGVEYAYLSSTSLTVNASVISNTGGFQFPDATIQTTASSPASTEITGGLPTAMSGSSTTASITISAAKCTDASLTTTLSWAGGTIGTGTGINTLGVATLANSTTYHVYLCKGASGTGIYASTTYSMGAASAPSGYTQYVRRLFSFLTTSAGAPQAFNADEITGGGYVAYLSTPTLDVSAATASTASRTLYTLSVPQGPKMQWQGRLIQNGSWVGTYTSPDEPDLTPSTTAAPLADTSVYSFSLGRTIMTNGSGQIGVRGASGGVFYLSTAGWIDGRRS